MHLALLFLSNGVDDESKRLDFYSNFEDLSNGYGTFLIDKTFKATDNSHASYSGCPSGVALMDCDGNVYRGSYAESAAYNPSLGPVQAALMAYVVGGGGGYERIVAAILVEKKEAVVLEENITRIVLKKVAPKCDFKAVHCLLEGNGK